jgi:hypothetical protein
VTQPAERDRCRKYLQDFRNEWKHVEAGEVPVCIDSRRSQRVTKIEESGLSDRHE